MASGWEEEAPPVVVDPVVWSHPGSIPAAKRGLDLCLATLILLVTLPLLPLIALAVRRDGGPIFFRQTRVGAGGARFELWKFRSMVVDAEDRLLSDPALHARFVAEGFKLHDDPRLTRCGRFLRHTSLDELPQLLSVLRGDMTMVGPRPILLSEEAAYDERGALEAYLSTRPGLTGPWQISGRSHTSYDDRVAMTIDYVANWSLGSDLRILARTARAVLRRTGAL